MIDLAFVAASIGLLIIVVCIHTWLWRRKLRKAREAIKRYDPTRYHTEIFACPKCNGRGCWQESFNPVKLCDIDPNGPVDMGLSVTTITVKCPICNGTGQRACRVENAT